MSRRRMSRGAVMRLAKYEAPHGMIVLGEMVSQMGGGRAGVLLELMIVPGHVGGMILATVEWAGGEFQAVDADILKPVDVVTALGSLDDSGVEDSPQCGEGSGEA